MVRPKKHLGQHFLHDENIARKILDAVPLSPPLLLEIGPGTGVLSKYLLGDDRRESYFLEVDHESADYLATRYPGIVNRLIRADFLRFPLEEFPAADRSGEPMLIAGNFPYNISSQILFRVLEYRNRITSLTGMFQKEVAERIIERPGSKTYGILSVLVQAWYDAEYLFTVSESVFNPLPKVKSAVIRLSRNNRNRLDCDEELFKKVVKTAFNQRRKTLHNALKPITAGISDESGLPFLGERAERLGVEEFVLLTREIAVRKS